ncbi:hypothetical protein BH11MYX3_BH11MYX3_48360 [soil metagenome]
MIPYEDLVIALQTWRAKQGLPVGQLSGALMPPAALTATSMSPSGPPSPPPKQAFLGNVATPPPLDAPIEDPLDVDDASLIEEAHYENEGDDFAMNFAGQGQHLNEDATAIGGSPTPRPSDNTLDDGTEVAPAAGTTPRNTRDDW